MDCIDYCNCCNCMGKGVVIVQLTLKAWRINAGLSLEDVASILGKTPRTIQNWESGFNIPDKANVYKLAKIYNTTIDNIFLGNHSALSERYKSNKEQLQKGDI